MTYNDCNVVYLQDSEFSPQVIELLLILYGGKVAAIDDQISALQKEKAALCKVRQKLREMKECA